MRLGARSIAIGRRPERRSRPDRPFDMQISSILLSPIKLGKHPQHASGLTAAQSTLTGFYFLQGKKPTENPANNQFKPTKNPFQLSETQ